MFTPPLFEPDILSTLLRTFSFYFRDGYWGYVYPVIMGLVLSQLLWIRVQPAVWTFPEQHYRFEWQTFGNKAALAAFFAAFAVSCAIVYTQEMSLFANFDLMSIGTTVTFVEGKGTGISDIRFSPFANVELNLFYAVSHNLYIVNGLVLAETVLLLYLLYRLFDFIPVTRRLYALALSAVYPALVWVNNPIFPERLMLIFICVSLLMLKKYLTKPKVSSLFLFCIFMNLALYTKETVILFYAGLLAAEVVYLAYKGIIMPVSFLHPIKTARQLPTEYIMFFSMAVFAFLYLLFGLGIDSNAYVSAHTGNEVWKKYYLEFFICFCATAALIFGKKTSFLPTGLLAGSWFILLFVAWKLGIYNENNGAYYAIVSGLFGLFIVFYAVEQKVFLLLFGAVYLVMAAGQNICLYHKQNGDAYADAARFIARLQDETNPQPIFVKDSLGGKYESYIIDCYRSAYKYYFPNRNFVFKTNSPTDTQVNFLKFPLIYQKRPQPGDLYIENKFYRSEVPDNYELLYENRLFSIFRVK